MPPEGATDVSVEITFCKKSPIRCTGRHEYSRTHSMSLRTLERQRLEPAVPGAVKGPPWAQSSLPAELGRQRPWLARRMGKQEGGGKPLAPWGELLMKPVDMRDNLNLRLIKLFPTSPLRFEPSCVLVEVIISQKKVRTMKSAVEEDWQERWFLIRKLMEIITEALEGTNGREPLAHQPSPTFCSSRIPMMKLGSLSFLGSALGWVPSPEPEPEASRGDGCDPARPQ